MLPCGVCRIAGLPFDAALRMGSSRLETVLTEIDRLRAEIESRRNDVSRVLYEAVGRASSRDIRRDLIRIRRDVFNDRVPPTLALEAARASLRDFDPHAANSFDAFSTLLRQRRDELAAFVQIYGEELGRTRALLWTWVDDEDFRRTLALASPPLYRDMTRHGPPTRAGANGRSEQTERGLLRYFLRASTKAAPFGRFCTIVGCAVETGAPDGNGESVSWDVGGELPQKIGHLRINKRLFKLLWRHLSSRAEVAGGLRVCVCHAVVIEGDDVLFVADVDGKEVCQRVTIDDGLRTVLKFVDANPHIAFRDLPSLISESDDLEASKEDAELYLDRLVQIGLLRFVTGIDEQDADWDIALVGLLSPIDDSHACAAVDLLQWMRSQLDVFAEASAAERALVVNDARARLEALIDAWSLDRELLRDVVFYEDATLDIRVHVRPRVMGTALGHLSEWIDLMMPLAQPRGRQAMLRRFFERKYGATGGAVTLFRFYEDYQRDRAEAGVAAHTESHAADASQAARDAGSEDRHMQFVTSLVETRAALAELVRSRWAREPAAAEVTIRRRDLTGLIAPLADTASSGWRVSAFCHVVPLDDRERPNLIVVKDGAILPGHGKYLSRFLYMLPDHLRNQIRDANESRSQSVHAEIWEDAHFNGNLHPCLTDLAIAYPTASAVPASNRLDPSDLEVVRSPVDPYAVWLRRITTGERVVPFDLGFLNYQRRPPLYQLLSHFSYFSGVAIEYPMSPIAPADPSAQSAETVPQEVADSETGAKTDRSLAGTVCRPRISYEGDVVLARRAWITPASKFPTQVRGETDDSYFLRVNSWRASFDVPRYVYVKVRKPRGSSARAKAALDAARRADIDEELGVAVADDGVAADMPGIDSAQDDLGHKASSANGALKSIWQNSAKPQFVDFCSPLLVRLLGRIGQHVEGCVVLLEECLPRHEDLLGCGDSRYATELILELDTHPISSLVAGD